MSDILIVARRAGKTNFSVLTLDPSFMKKNNVISIKKSWLDRLKKFIKEEKKLADRYLKDIKD